MVSPRASPDAVHSRCCDEKTDGLFLFLLTSSPPISRLSVIPTEKWNTRSCFPDHASSPSPLKKKHEYETTGCPGKKRTPGMRFPAHTKRVLAAEKKHNKRVLTDKTHHRRNKTPRGQRWTVLGAREITPASLLHLNKAPVFGSVGQKTQRGRDKQWLFFFRGEGNTYKTGTIAVLTGAEDFSSVVRTISTASGSGHHAKYNRTGMVLVRECTWLSPAKQNKGEAQV
ncbi:MAG: uncharacterized protein A8A55_2275 [Amphiamblys sp. WSBS2006]|nr:MAG: uncharacterized protein A8A55_2275 [Amphiamblys sp. WSBS2006]